jgi:hypothetical protein
MNLSPSGLMFDMFDTAGKAVLLLARFVARTWAVIAAQPQQASGERARMTTHAVCRRPTSVRYDVWVVACDMVSN